ncbi:MAG: CHAT domain-containing protein [Crocosphaera sp.]
MKLSDIQGILDAETVIWEWYIIPPQEDSKESYFYTFIITHNHIDVVPSNSEQLDQLIDWAKDYLESYYGVISSFWKLVFVRGAETLGLSLLWAMVLQKWYNWYNFTQKLEILWERLLIPQLLDKTPEQCKKLVLIPHQYLHLFPIHAISGNINDQPMSLQKRFEKGIQYIPSCQLLQRLYQKSQNPEKKASETSFFGIKNPTLDLKFSKIEVESIEKQFIDRFVFPEGQPTKIQFQQTDTIKQLRESDYVHFACHGLYNFNKPLESVLCLASNNNLPQKTVKQRKRQNPERYITLRDGEEYDITQGLQLKDIFARITLPKCYLVILSACQTGVTNFNLDVDEYIGLGTGFLYAGSLHVINTLWNIDDFVTAIFMIHCYQQIIDKHQPVPIALQLTQKWIRETKTSEIIQWFEELENKKIIDEATKYDMITVLTRDYYQQNPPFQNPNYWAAFCSLGLIH